VISDVDVPGFDQIGDGLGTVADYSGEGLAFVADVGSATVDGAGEIVAGTDWEQQAENVQGLAGDAAGAAGDAVTNFDLEQQAENVGDAVGAAGEYGGDAVDAIGDANMDDMADVGKEALGCCQKLWSSILGGAEGGEDLVGDVIGVMDKE